VFEPGIGEGRRGMAQRTIVGDWDMGRVDLGRGANGIDPAVAGRTVVHYPGVIEYSRLKAATGGVADLAILGCIKVAGVPTFCPASAIGYMTGIAAYGQHCRVVVVDKRIGKIGRVMAQSTIGRGSRVRWSRRLASGTKRNKTRAAIVAGGTIAGNACVCKHRCWGETCSRMTDVAILASRQVACGLVQRRISREELAGMTTFATVSDIHMLRGKKCRRSKTARIGVVVTCAASAPGRDMIGFFPYGPSRNIIGIAIVTGLTIVANTRVREVNCRRERRRGRMANDAVLGCRNMN